MPSVVVNGVGKFGCSHQWVSMNGRFVCVNKRCRVRRRELTLEEILPPAPKKATAILRFEKAA